MNDVEELPEPWRSLIKADGPTKLVAAAIVFAIGAWLFCAFSLVLFGFPSSQSGPWGDTFNAAGTLISLLALCAIGYTVSLQRDELRTTREEAKSTLLVAEVSILTVYIDIAGRKVEQLERHSQPSWPAQLDLHKHVSTLSFYRRVLLMRRACLHADRDEVNRIIRRHAGELHAEMLQAWLELVPHNANDKPEYTKACVVLVSELALEKMSVLGGFAQEKGVALTRQFNNAMGLMMMVKGYAISLGALVIDPRMHQRQLHEIDRNYKRSILAFSFGFGRPEIEILKPNEPLWQELPNVDTTAHPGPSRSESSQPGEPPSGPRPSS